MKSWRLKNYRRIFLAPIVLAALALTLGLFADRHQAVSAQGPSALYNLTGFARAATGGGILPETDPNYRKVFTPDDLVTALADKNTKVIEIMNDLNLGYNEVPATARRSPLRANSAYRIDRYWLPRSL